MCDSRNYEADLARITHSGPHEINDDRRAVNREAWSKCQDIMPIDDIHKICDCDLLYRFLIAHRWDVKNAVQAIHDYAAYRKEHNLNAVLWEEFPDELMPLLGKYQGYDREGHPIFYDKPDPRLIAELLHKFPRDILIRTHFAVMEQGRRLQKVHGVDRVSCVMDLSLVSMGIVANPRAVGFLKEITKTDQQLYPENMRTMLLCQSPWAFSVLWKVIRPLLDERVQKKIQFISGGANMAADISKFIELDQVPRLYGGVGTEDQLNLCTEDFHALPVGTPPVMRGDTKIAADASVLPPFPGHFLTSPQQEWLLRGSPALSGAAGGAMVKAAEEEVSPAAGEQDVGDELEFHSIPSDNDDDVCDTTPPAEQATVQVAVAEVSSSLVAPLSTDASILQLRVPPTSNAAGGARRLEAFVVGSDKALCYSTGNTIVNSDANSLCAELLLEAGHPMHAFIIVVDETKTARFILKKRNFHKELQVFHPVNGKIVVKKNMQAAVDGDRHHVYTVRLRDGSNDLRDWQITAHGRKNDGHLATKVGDVVKFSGCLLREGRPELLFALTAAIQEMWYFCA